MLNRILTFFHLSQNDELITRLLTRRYIVALSLIVIMVTSAWVTMTIFISKNKDNALIVNISGRQRMLSQQTALLSMQLVHSKAEQRSAIREKLIKSIKLMQNSHLALIHGDADIGLSVNISSQIRSMYFKSPLELDAQIQSYLSAIQELLETPEDKLSTKTALLESTILPPLDRLLESLDKVVVQYQTEGELTISNIQKAENFILLFTLLLLMLEGIFIFYPTILQTRNFIRLRNQYESQLIEAKEEAEHANLAKSQFLSSMSHELRTPLNAILGFSQLIVLDEKDEDKKNNVQDVIDAGNHLLDLINEVLDLTKIESGKITLSIKEYSLNKILKDTLSMIKPLADKHAIQIEDYVGSLPDININVDDMRFKQVLLNILSNAIKYNREKGKVTIDGASTDNNIFCLSISDTGKGFTIKQLGHLFEPLERFGEENSHTEGTGLGLVIAKDLIELMGGTMTVESEVGNGSRFIIEVPLS